MTSADDLDRLDRAIRDMSERGECLVLPRDAVVLTLGEPLPVIELGEPVAWAKERT